MGSILGSPSFGKLPNSKPLHRRLHSSVEDVGFRGVGVKGRVPKPRV